MDGEIVCCTAVENVEMSYEWVNSMSSGRIIHSVSPYFGPLSEYISTLITHISSP